MGHKNNMLIAFTIDFNVQNTFFYFYRMCILDLGILFWYFYIFPLGNIICVHAKLEVSRSTLPAQL